MNSYWIGGAPVETSDWRAIRVNMLPQFAEEEPVVNRFANSRGSPPSSLALQV